MALVLKDRVREQAATTGTGTFTLSGSAYDGYRTFASCIPTGSVVYYCIHNTATGFEDEWEVGYGTFTLSGNTLSRTSIMASSNAGAAVDFSAGTKEVFITYPAEMAVYEGIDNKVANAAYGTINVDSLSATAAALTSGTVSATPSAGTDIANKTYVDTVATTAIDYHLPVRGEVPDTTGNLTVTYNNGASGVGATLTNAGTQAAFAYGGVSWNLNDRVLVYNQTSALQNGVYTITDLGSSTTNWVLTRATDADSYGVNDPNALDQGSAFFVQEGDGAGETYACNTPGVITFGTTAITFTQISAAQIYSAGTGLTLSGTQFSITNTGTAGTYGTANSVPVLTTNAQGQVTSATNTAIAIAAGAVSGLAASATTDTTNAANISSGTLPSGRLSGSYTGITGVGTLTAGTWTASTVGVGYGGTGLTSYTTGDIVYASASGTLASLADVATGNALISGGVGVAPSYGKIGLTTHITGTLAVANGGTGATTLTGYVYGNGTSAMTASTTIPGSAISGNISGNAAYATSAGSVTYSLTPGSYLTGSAYNGGAAQTFAVDATATNTASKVVARDASGNFSAGTITATLSGNATTATTASDCSGNAATATALATGRTIGMTGDVSYTSPSFNGTANVSAAATLANSGVTAGTYTYSTVTVDAKGRVTAAASGAAPSAFPSGTVMMFAQTAAPTGWTKSVAHDNKALRVVSGTASSGGTVAFTTAFASKGVSGTISSTTATNQNTTAAGTVGSTTATNLSYTPSGSVSVSVSGSVGSTTLDSSTMPSHNHLGGMLRIWDAQDGYYGTASNVGNYGYQVARWPTCCAQADLDYTSSTGSSGSHNHSFSGSGSGSFSGNAATITQNAHTHSFTGTAHTHTQDAHTHTFSGTAIDLAVQYVDVILASKD